MKILVATAVARELAHFRARDGVECLVTGMGPRSARAVRDRIRRGGVSRVVSTGFAGGIRPGFEVGDLVVASEVIEAGSGRRWRPESLRGFNGLASVGPFLTVGRILSDPASKLSAGAKFGAIAADLETAAVAEAAHQSGVPWVALRAILDPTETSLAVTSRWQALALLVSGARRRRLQAFLDGVQTASRSLALGLGSLVDSLQMELQEKETGRWISNGSQL